MSTGLSPSHLVTGCGTEWQWVRVGEMEVNSGVDGVWQCEVAQLAGKPDKGA